MAKKYQVTRTDTVLANATSTLIYGRPDCTDVLGETDSLKEAIEIAHSANQNREGFSGARVVQGENHVVMMSQIPLAYNSLREFKTEFRRFEAATDDLTLKQLRDRMESYYYGVEGGS